jgi:hypothetical protein
MQGAIVALLNGESQSMRNFIIGTGLLLAPFGQIAAEIILAVPGSNQAWVPAHLLMMGSLYCYVAVILGANQLLGIHKGLWGVFGDGATALALVGLLLLLGQVTIDITVGLLASTPGEMEQMFGKIRAIPAMEYAYYSIGPALFFLGFFLLILLLARFRVLALWSAGVAGAGIIFGVIGMGLNVLPSFLLVPLSLGSIWIGFLPITWKVLTNRERAWGLPQSPKR